MITNAENITAKWSPIWFPFLPLESLLSLSSGQYAARQKGTRPKSCPILSNSIRCSAGAAQSHKYGSGAA